MSSLVLSPRLRKLIASEMTAGKYKSPDALLVEALGALADRRGAIEGIGRGLADAQTGRQRSRKEFRRQLLKRHPYLADS